MIEELNRILKADLKESVVESWEKSEHIDNLEKMNENILEKLEKAEYNYTKLEITYLSKEKEIETIKVKEGTILTENNSFKVDVKKLSE